MTNAELFQQAQDYRKYGYTQTGHYDQGLEEAYQQGFMAAVVLLKQRLQQCAMEHIGPGDAAVGAAAVLQPFSDLLS